MKTSAKHFFPEIHLHISPINRDLLLIAAFGLIVATAILTMLVMAVSRI
ncbi:MAG TPA: hypothetical protein VGQ59_01390 [Cyclobacteriaceae bacterium]|jgi:hypothetical protein|nr:hypothetical protein [Cyclobacteriaceae bacterium]